MQKLLFHSLIFSILMIYFHAYAEGQETHNSFEFAGGTGISWVSNSTKNEILNIYNRQFNSNIEKWESELNPGLFTSAELRIFKNGDKFRIGAVISYSQYATVVHSTVERESLGVMYIKEKRNGRDYKLGMGANIQYTVLRLNNHQFSPFLFLGLEFNRAYNIRYDQEVKFFLDEKPGFYQLTLASRYKSDERNLFGRLDFGLNYTYNPGALSPFAELGLRYVSKNKDNEYALPEDWWAVYVNLGLRYSF